MLKSLAAHRFFNNVWVSAAVCVLVALIIGVEATQITTLFGSSIFMATYNNPPNFHIGLITGAYPLFCCGNDELWIIYFFFNMDMGLY